MTESPSQHLRRIQELFEEALTYPAGEARERYLNDSCAGNNKILGEVQRLLRHYSAIEPTIGRALPMFGAYQATRIIGRGGMGVVYEAHRADGQYERRVAVKVIASGLITNFLHEELRRERQILASLDHPGIARLFDGGVDETGAPYQVMELIDGLHLDRYCNEHNLTTSARLSLFHQVLNAVEYAHSLGVVHRDLKPPNILVDANGRAKLLDFGAARFLRSGDATVTSRCFTPEYASPELMAGESVDQRADIYSLGVLYAKLLGADSRSAIVRKAKSQAPGDRYASVAQFRLALDKNARPALQYAVATLLLLGCLTAFYLWRKPTQTARSIAVLPFVNASATQDQYIADGLTQDLTDSLAQTSTLRVIARSAAAGFTANNLNLQDLRRRLSVDLILTGQVNRSQTSSTVKAELRRLPSGDRVWSQTYQVEGQSLAPVNLQIASAVASSLHVKKASAKQPQLFPVNDQAYDLTQRASHDMQQFTPAAYAAAEHELRQSIQLDPHYARAYFLLGDLAWSQSNVRGDSVRTGPELQQSAAMWRKALELSPKLSAARAMLAKVDLQYSWNWAQAETQLQQAVASSSDYSSEDAYSFLLMFEGRSKEAIEHRRRAEELDPVSVESRVNSSLFWFQMGNFERSKEACDQLKSAACFNMTTVDSVALNRLDLVAGALKNADPRNQSNPIFQAMLAARKGDRDEALRIIRPLEVTYLNLKIPRQWLALVYAQLNDIPNTVKWLNRSADAHEWQVLVIGVHPFYQNMHNDPAFQALEHRIGLKQ